MKDFLLIKLKNKMAKKNKSEVIEKIVKDLISLLDVEVKITLEEDPRNEAIMVQIETPSAGLLIGHHGESLDALQLVSAILVQRELSEWVRIMLNVGDWREKREEVIKALATRAAQKAKFTGLPQPIFDLSPHERRIVHLFLGDEPQVSTESEGEGKERHIVVKPRPQ